MLETIIKKKKEKCFVPISRYDIAYLRKGGKIMRTFGGPQSKPEQKLVVILSTRPLTHEEWEEQHETLDGTTITCIVLEHRELDKIGNAGETRVVKDTDFDLIVSSYMTMRKIEKDPMK